MKLTSNALASILAAALLPHGQNLKHLVAAKGEDLAKAELERLGKQRVSLKASSIAVEMQHEGWSWDGAAHTPDEGLGRGFVLSRTALYKLIEHAFGARGGLLVDGVRDATDNAVWAAIAPKVIPGTTGLTELVELTGSAFVVYALSLVPQVGA
jgi:hypothetical protein